MVVVLPGSAGWWYPGSGIGTQGFWPHTPQLFSCGSARPGEWLATKMPLHGGSQSRRGPECFISSPLLFCQWTSIRTATTADSMSGRKDEWDNYCPWEIHRNICKSMLTFMIPIITYGHVIINIYNIRYIPILYDSDVLQTGELCLGTSRTEDWDSEQGLKWQRGKERLHAEASF